MPGHPQTSCDAGDGEVSHDQALHRPPQAAAGDLRSRFGRRRRVVPPDLPAAGATIAANPDQQDRGPPAERFVREAPRDSVPNDALRATFPGPRVRFGDAAFQDHPVQFQAFADGA